MTAGEFANLVAISQVTPGPVVVNAATYVGYIVGTICHINLDATGGTCKVNSFMVLWGSSFTQSELPIPTREGYTFKGWTGTPESDEPFISISPIWDEETLYAIWEPNS